MNSAGGLDGLSRSKLELCEKPIRANKVKSFKMEAVCGGGFSNP